MSPEANCETVARQHARRSRLAALSVVLVAILANPSQAAEEKAPGEDLITAELSALVAELKQDQLSKRGTISIIELKEKYLKDLELMNDGTRATIRGICAAHRMPVVKQRVDAAEPAPVLPEVYTYCLKAIDVTAKRDRLADLYINLALQAQGRSQFQFTDDAELVKNNEPGRTRLAILKAANAGEATYQDITGRTKELPCPLAFDAGYTWAFNSPEKSQPYEFAAADIERITRACYDPSVEEITLSGAPIPAQKVGLFAGAWLGRVYRTQPINRRTP